MQSRVKARLFAKALRQLFENAGDVVVMGHKNADMDCLGAALGVAPDMSAPREIVEPRIYIAGKAPVQQAMIDVLEALGHEGAIAVPRELSARMGVTGAAEIGL